MDVGCGACDAIDGGVQEVSNLICIITQSGVEVSGDLQESLNGVDMASRGNKFEEKGNG